MDYNTILKTLSVQQVKRKTITITFPEGYTAVAIAQKMEENGLCSVDDFLACANGEDGSDFSQYDFWNAIPDTEGRLMKCEGYLFPDTYEFFTDDSVYNYVNTFYKEFDTKTSDLWDTINEKGTTMNDVVILASFIQEEAGMPAEDAKVSACFHIAVQDGFDTNDCIKDVRTCISFKRSETLNIEDIILARLIREISILDSCKRYHPGSLLGFLVTDIEILFLLLVLRNLLEHLLIDLIEEIFQTHNATVSGLKRLSILTVHCTESDMGQLYIISDKSGLSCTAEYLDKMHTLSLVSQINNTVRIVILHTHHNRCKICRTVERSSIRL